MTWQKYHYEIGFIQQEMRILGYGIPAKGKINFPVICKKFAKNSLHYLLKFKNLSFFDKIVTFNEFRQLVYQFDIYTSTLNQEINIKTTILTQYRAS